MVSGPPAGAHARRALGLSSLLSVFVWVSLLAGCSKSECLRPDCQTGDAGVTSEAGAPAPAPAKCSASTDCDASQGEICVDGGCRIPCHSHYDCQGFGECVNGTSTEATTVHYCDLSHPQKPGQFYTHCPNGDSDCDTANGFLCIGDGTDDLDAYCSVDCSADTDCADGFGCSPLTRSPCAADCNLSAAPADPQCVPSAQIGVGKPYQCGSHGVTRNVCRPHEFCSSCTTDADCLAATDQICAQDKSGAKICTQLCDQLHPSCPWGSATSCGLYDKDVGAPTCAHRFGSCTGDGKSCDPCLKDSDCGSNGACTASEFTGEHWCVDFNVTCSCVGLTETSSACTGGGCPNSPSGLTLQCVDTALTGMSGVCNGANTANTLLGGSPQTGCWPAK